MGQLSILKDLVHSHNDMAPELCGLLLQPAPTGGAAGTCNANMPNNSVYTRFLYVIKVRARCRHSCFHSACMNQALYNLGLGLPEMDCPSIVRFSLPNLYRC